MDLEERKLEFWRNGVSMGVAFHNIPRDTWLFPAVSLRQYQRISPFLQSPFFKPFIYTSCEGVIFNFGETSFRFAPKEHLPFHSLLTDSQRNQLENLFVKYKSEGIKLSESGEDYGDIIKAEGTLQLVKDLGATDDHDPLLFVISWKLNCKRGWEIDRKEWNSLAVYGIR